MKLKFYFCLVFVILSLFVLSNRSFASNDKINLTESQLEDVLKQASSSTYTLIKEKSINEETYVLSGEEKEKIVETSLKNVNNFVVNNNLVKEQQLAEKHKENEMKNKKIFNWIKNLPIIVKVFFAFALVVLFIILCDGCANLSEGFRFFHMRD